MDRLRDSLLALGVPGLFLIALLDSAGVPLPGSVDLILILLAWQKPSLFLVIALVAAAGSTVGCLILYRLGRTGGEVALRRLDHEKLKLATEKVRKNDVLAIVVARSLPSWARTRSIVRASRPLAESSAPAIPPRG